MEPQKVDSGTFYSALRHKNIKSLVVYSDGQIDFKLKQIAPGSPTTSSLREKTNIPRTALDGNGWAIMETQAHQYAVPSFNYKKSNDFLNIFLVDYLPFILVFAIVYFLVSRQFRSAGGGMSMLGNFGRSRHRMMSKELTNITFNDVAGIDEAKEELAEIVDFLKNPKKFQRLGGPNPAGRIAGGTSGRRQNTAGQSHRWRSGGTVFLHQWFRFRGNVCRRWCFAGAGSFPYRQGKLALHCIS